MDNCRGFMDALINEFQHHLYTKMNVMRQATILEIADRIVEFTLKSDIEYYFYFLINACPYAETFEDEHRMRTYISKMEKYFDCVSDKLSKAVYFMCRATFAKIFSDDNAIAIDYTKSALEFVPNVLDGGNYSRQEIELCFNINNNIGTFYYESGDFLNAHNYYKNALDIYRIYPDKLSTAAVMELTLNLRELRLAVENRNLIALNVE